MRERIIGIVAVFSVLLLVSTVSATPVVNLTSNNGSSDITVSPGSTITVNLSLDIGCSGINYIDFLTLGDISINNSGNWISAMQDYFGNGSVSNSSIIDAYGNTSGNNVSAGTNLYSFEAIVNGDGNISPYMGASDAVFSETATYFGGGSGDLTMSGLTVSIPEPATVLLLGAAGLFIRKRKN